MQLKRRWAMWVGLIVGLGALTLGVGPAAGAKALVTAEAAGSECSLTTLQGPYLFSGSGFQIVGNDRAPLVYAGHTMFDGKGGVHDNVLTRSLNGVITRHITSTGSYTVAPDCSGTLTINGTSGDLHYDLYIALDGSELTFIGSDPGSASAGWEPRAIGKRAAG